MVVARSRSVLITGCSSGIGRCVAAGLKQRGYRVFATARKQQDVRMLTDEGFESCRLDLANSASIQAAVETVLDATDGRIYGLFNNAGYGQPGALEDITRDSLREQFEVNLFGSHELTTLLIPAMRKQGEGRIIQHSSVLGFIALKYRGAYNASKFAIEGLADTLRMELAGSGIHVSLIDTGPVTSNFRVNAYAAFRRNIDRNNSFYKDIYATIERRLSSDDDETPFTMGPEAVLDKVIHALESRHPKARYYVTLPTYAFAFLKRVLPDRLMDWILIKASGAEHRQFSHASQVKKKKPVS
ncbi:MAG: SDR family NAD(P)-dependent oxidoreductase [Gammaproteobacteria bacterium]